MHSDITTPTTNTKATADETKFWTPRNYILASLGGTLAVTAIIIIVSVILGPAHISFSIVHASRSDPRAIKGGTQQIPYLNLTITATNGSRKRAAVRYRSVFVDLKNSTSAAGRNTMHAKVYAAPPTDDYLRPGTAPAIFNASVGVLATGTSGLFVSRRLNGTGFTVVVSASVRFRVGRLRTRVYDIKVSCPRVYFPVEGSSNVTAPPINCTA
ncbi:hypothetical protein VPH35_069711 [Triticum aestivum]